MCLGHNQFALRYRQPTSTQHPNTQIHKAPAVQSVSPLAPIGVSAALETANDQSVKPKPKIFDEFALIDRVGIISGGNRGLGLEMALALCEAGARAIYCFDLPTTPSEEWQKTQNYIKKMDNGSRLEYVSVDVTNQEDVWKQAKDIGDKEGRMDICVAAAGILKTHTDCLTYPAEQFKAVGIKATSSQLYINAWPRIRCSMSTPTVCCTLRRPQASRCAGMVRAAVSY